MRWFWIDRFTEFVRGLRATALKNVSLSEEPLDDYLIGFPHYPHSLIIEGVAQTGGLLIAEADGFQKRVVLAKVGKATFGGFVRPGDQLTLAVEIVDLQASGGIVQAVVTKNSDGGLPDRDGGDVADEPNVFAELELSFAFLDGRFGDAPLFPPEDLMRTLRILHLYDVAVDAEGNRIRPPEHLLAAERASSGT